MLVGMFGNNSAKSVTTIGYYYVSDETTQATKERLLQWSANFSQ